MQPMAEEAGLAGPGHWGPSGSACPSTDRVPDPGCAAGGGRARRRGAGAREARVTGRGAHGQGDQKVPADVGLLGVSVDSGCLHPEPPPSTWSPELHEYPFSQS